GLFAVSLVDSHGPRGADAVRLEKDHDAAHRLLFLPAFADALQAARADAFHLLEERRALVDDRQGAFAEYLNNFTCEVRADPLDQAGAEILLNPFHRVRRRGAQLVRLELEAVLAVVDPGAGPLDVLTRHD